MSGYRLPLLAIILPLIIIGCAPQPAPTASSHEDEYALYAYDALLLKEYDEAHRYFDLLYRESGSGLYLKESLRILLFQKEFKPAIASASDFLKTAEDSDIRKLLIEALKNTEAYDQAQVESEKLLAYEQTVESYVMAAEVYFLKKAYKKSIEYYKKAYDIEPSDYVVDKIAEVLYVNMQKSDEAIQYYETHIRFHGCSKYLCQRMASLYARKGDVDGVISAYMRIYETDQDNLIGRKVIDLYLLKNDYPGLQEFLEMSRLDDMMLLKLLKHNREFKEAADVAFRIYKKNGEIDYFAQYAMFTYESGNQKDKALIKQTIANLRSVIKENNSHVYLNYLGYLLIDSGINVKEGLGLVKQALEQDKENLSYLDSLAWGYYKQKQYTKAYETITRLKGALDDPIVKEHFEMIKKKYDTIKKRK
jgi:tetratricopeptide (TPR) repeat protein